MAVNDAAEGRMIVPPLTAWESSVTAPIWRRKPRSQNEVCQARGRVGSASLS